MKRWKNTVVGLRGLSCLLAVGIWLGLCQPSYGEATAVETIGTMEIQEQLMKNGANLKTSQPNEVNEIVKASPKPSSEANNATKPTLKKPAAGERMAAPKLSTDTNIPDINDFNDSQQRELNRINFEARSEERQWLGQLDNKKAELARAIDDVVTAELRFIRKLASAEDVNKTTKAIDLVLKQRQERLEKLVTKLEDEMKQERQKQPPERREKKITNRTERPKESKPPEKH